MHGKMVAKWMHALGHVNDYGRAKYNQPTHQSEENNTMRSKVYQVREKANGYLVEIDRVFTPHNNSKPTAENQYLFNTLDDAWRFIGNCMEEDFADKPECEC